MTFSFETWRKYWSMVPHSNGLVDWNEIGEDIRFILRSYYSEPWRHYHDTRHVEHFQDALDEMQCENPAVRIAGYFHDIIWLPGYSYCELRSAQLARAYLERFGVQPEFIDTVERLILATVHTGLRPVDILEAQVRDADLWTLGCPYFDVFMDTQDLIRQEFAHVPPDQYMKERREIFARFGRIQLFWTPQGCKREEKARENLIRVGVFDGTQPEDTRG